MKSTRHLLIIRLSAMGDVAMCVPVIQRLRAQYPHLQITVLTKAFFKPIIETIPEVNVYTAEVKHQHKGLKGLLKLARELKAKNIDAVADFHDVLRSKIVRTSLKIFGVKSAKIDKGRSEKRALTREKNKILTPLKTSHERYADVLKKLGFPIQWHDKIKLKKQILPHVLKKKPVGNQKWIGLAPFAAHQAKVYPSDLMEELINHLNNLSEYEIFLFGGGKTENATIEQLAGRYNNVSALAVKIPFAEQIALMSHLDAMISMDSGNGHLAAMFDVPVITIWGATHPFAGFAPFQQKRENQLLPDLEKYPLLPTSIYGNKNIKGYEQVMRGIAPRDIALSLKKCLAEKN